MARTPEWQAPIGPGRGTRKLRYSYIVAGLAWGLLLAPLVFIVTAGSAAGVSWLWLFGDDPWPEGAGVAIVAVGGVLAAAAAFGCAIGGFFYGRWRETLPEEARKGEDIRIVLVALAPLALMVLGGLGVWEQERAIKAQRGAEARRAAGFVTLAASGQRITGIEVAQGGDGLYRAEITFSGIREGAHLLSWRVIDRGYRATLREGELALTLKQGERKIEVQFTLEDLAAGYRDKVLSGRGGVLVDEPFRFEAVLWPQLSKAEIAGLPAAEYVRLRNNDGPLVSRAAQAFPVRFILRPDGSISR